MKLRPTEENEKKTGKRKIRGKINDMKQRKTKNKQNEQKENKDAYEKMDDYIQKAESKK